MKFGKNLVSHQIPEWLVFYINYKPLKKIIKQLQSLPATDLEPVLSLFFYELDRSVETVDEFYNLKFGEYSKRLRRVVSTVGYLATSTVKLSRCIDFSEKEEIILILFDLRAAFRKLQWFGEINYKGFVKILKKLDKKLGGANQESYLQSRIDPLLFALGKQLGDSLATIKNILYCLGAEDESGVPTPKTALETDNLLVVVAANDAGALNLLIGNQLPKLLTSLLIKATAADARACIDVLVTKLAIGANPFVDNSDISGRSFFHQLMIYVGKTDGPQKYFPGEPTKMNHFFGSNGEADRHSPELGLAYILGSFPNESKVLINKDAYMRTPLHYAGQYGLREMVKIIAKYLKDNQLIGTGVPIDNVDYWGDQDGLTPLHLAIIGNHPITVNNLVEESIPLLCGQLLLMAARHHQPAIIEVLVAGGGLDVNYTDVDHHNETALYIACKFNHYEVAEFLLTNDADPEICELVFGWTPLFIAANEGYSQMVRLLKEFNAQVDVTDDSGWLPMEHSCLRGHLDTADLLRPSDPSILMFDMYHPENNLQRKRNQVMQQENLLSLLVDILPEHSREVYNKVYEQLRKRNDKKVTQVKPIKLFGHRYLHPGDKVVLITLGLTDLRQKCPPIELHNISLSQAYATEMDTALLLMVSLKHRASNEVVDKATVVDLPLDDLHASATDPILFRVPTTVDIEDLVVCFDLIPTYQYPNKKAKFARAMAILKDAYTPVGPQLRSLNTGISAALLDVALLDTIGEVRFEFLPITAFVHPEMSITPTDTYWKQLVSTRVIGHRGLGKNMDNKSLQLGENTMELFIAAASLGASYIEFDVQLTKDLVPVVYHDFTVAELGADIPMHLLTLEQFLELQDEKTRETSRGIVDDHALMKTKRLYPLSPNFHVRHTKESDDAIDKEFRDQMSRRMKLTKTWKAQGYKGNARGLNVALKFVTLVELFQKVPNTVGFNIELKYPMLDEAELEQMGEIAIDLNTYIDTILKVIYDANVAKRDIIFSLFHPDVCALLSMKQPSIPILFLTESGTSPMYDIRALLLQNAIRFAKKWNLLGIVLAAEALVKCPRLAQVVKLQGLVCVTYGVENNDPELAKIQMKAGVDAVIADLVLAVREGIRGDQEGWNQPHTPPPVETTEKILENEAGELLTSEV